MSGKTKVIVNISKCNDGDAILKTDIVLGHLTENAVEFPNPTVSLSTMRTNKVDLEKKIVNAQNGGVEDTRKKNKARDIVNNNYRSNGNYVNSVINGSKAKALLSGYELAKQRSKSVKDVFELVNTKIPGQIIVYCRQSPKYFIVKLLQCSYTPEIESSWFPCGYTRKIKKIVRNLESGTRIWIRLAIVMDEDIAKFCDPISIIVT